MLTTNRLAVLKDVGCMELVEEEMPVPQAGEVLVRITHAGVCGSDLHYFRHGGLGSFKTPLPMYMGHEPSGIVVDPNGVDPFEFGDRVAMEPGCPCLDSKFSMLGKHNLCEKGTFMGADGKKGCFADFVCVSKTQVLKVPDNVELELASLCEPLSVALHTLKLCRHVLLDLLEDSVAIFGGGAIGLCHLLMLKHHGASNVYVVDPYPYRRELAIKLGAAGAFPYEGSVTSIMTATKKDGCKLVIDCAGNPDSFMGSMNVAAPAGLLALVGIPEVDYLCYNPHKARIKELTVINVRRSNQCLNACLGLMSSSEYVRNGCQQLISHRLPLRDIQHAFDVASNYKGGVKIVMTPELRTWRTQRIGLVGLSSYGIGYLKHLLAHRHRYTLLYATSVCNPSGDVAALENELATLCQVHAVPYLGRIDVNQEVDRLAAYEADIVILTSDSIVPSGDFLARAACSHGGVINTHLGLLPPKSAADRGHNPWLWAILGDEPQGLTTYFLKDGVQQSEEVIDIREVQMPTKCDSQSAYSRLCDAAVARFPCWLQAIETGHFDMSMCNTLQRSKGRAKLNGNHHKPGMPNDRYVSWHWRCRFIERFSDAVSVQKDSLARTETINGSELCFRVLSTLSLEALLAEGMIRSFAESQPGAVVSSSGPEFMVRAVDGFLRCTAGAGSEAPSPGNILCSIGDRGPHGVPEKHADEEFVVKASSLLNVQPAIGMFDAAGYPTQGSEPTHAETRAVIETCHINGKASVASTAIPCANGVDETPRDQRKVPIFQLEFEPELVDGFMEGSREILTSGRPLSESHFARKFEASFAELVHAKFALVTTSGTTALDIALRALDVSGRKVVVPSNTFFATQVAALNAKATLEWVDVEAEYMQICPQSLEKVLGRHPKSHVAAVVLVHIAGIISPHFRQIRDICRSHGVALVEDAAHAHLAHSGGEFAGTIGDVGAFSFFATKVMTAGEAGMITTSREDLYEKMKSIKEFGRDIHGPKSQLVQLRQDGTNGRITEFQGLLGTLECGRVRNRIERRNLLVARYSAYLDVRNYKVLRQKEGCSADYKCVVLLLGALHSRREELRSFAASRGVSFTGEVYFKPVHAMPAYSEDAAASAPVLPVTEHVCANHVCPPLYPELSTNDVDHVIAVMNEFAEGSTLI